MNLKKIPLILATIIIFIVFVIAQTSTIYAEGSANSVWEY